MGDFINKKPKILIYDIETSPLIGYAWTPWETNLIEVIQDYRLLSVSWKWVGSPKVRFMKDRYPSDAKIANKIKELWSQADVIVAHNGDQFDQKKSKTRMIAADRFTPPKTVVSVDTKKVAKAEFGFTGNSLNELGKFFGFGEKASTGGFPLWKDCMAHKSAAWKKMEKYNKRDVKLLEKIYLVMRPWQKNHPNLSLLEGRKASCPSGCKAEAIKNGFRASNAGMRQRWACRGCGACFLTSLSAKRLP